MLEWSEVLLRLGLATLASGLIGLNRDLHGKPIGIRTLGLVGLSAAAIVIIALPPGSDAERLTDATSRVIQGIMTGIGFLGAGVIIHLEQSHKVRGLTSAASVWFTACVGIICGAGQWRLVTAALSIGFLLLMFGGRIERMLHKLLGIDKPSAEADSETP